MAGSSVSPRRDARTCELCSWRGLASLPSRPMGELMRLRCDSVDAYVSLFSTCGTSTRRPSAGLHHPMREPAMVRLSQRPGVSNEHPSPSRAACLMLSACDMTHCRGAGGMCKVQTCDTPGRMPVVPCMPQLPVAME